jgi:hypothetical protein
MDIVKFTSRVHLRDVIYGLVGALLMGVNCYIAAIIYPQIPEFVFRYRDSSWLSCRGLFWKHSRIGDFAISWCSVTEHLRFRV